MDALKILGLNSEPTPKVLQQQYRKLIKAHPPDVEPIQFRKIRTAYELLCNPRKQAKRRVLGPDPISFHELERLLPIKRRRCSKAAWIRTLQELRKQ